MPSGARNFLVLAYCLQRFTGITGIWNLPHAKHNRPIPRQLVTCHSLQVAAGSVVLRDLPPQVVAAGVPAKVIGVATEGQPSETVDQNLKYVRYPSKAGNGSGNRSVESNGGLDAKGGGSGAGGTGARKDASSAARRRSVGVRGIEEKKRSFL